MRRRTRRMPRRRFPVRRRTRFRRGRRRPFTRGRGRRGAFTRRRRYSGRSARRPLVTNFGGAQYAVKLHAGVPQRRFVTLRYPINNILTSGKVHWQAAGYDTVFPVTTLKVYRGNSVTDPVSVGMIVPGAGGEALGLRAWANFYKASYVFSSTLFLRVTVLPMRVYSAAVHSAVAPDVDLIVMAKTPTAEFPTDRVTSYFYPRNHVKWVHMSAKGRDVWTTTVRMRRTTKQMFRSNQEEITPGTANNPFVQLAPAMDTRFYERITAGSTTAVAPDFTWFWMFQVWNRSPGADILITPNTVGGQVEWTAEGFIDYHTVLCNPNQLTIPQTSVDTAGEDFTLYDEPATAWIDEVI